MVNATNALSRFSNIIDKSCHNHRVIFARDYSHFIGIKSTEKVHVQLVKPSSNAQVKLIGWFTKSSGNITKTLQSSSDRAKPKNNTKPTKIHNFISLNKHCTLCLCRLRNLFYRTSSSVGSNCEPFTFFGGWYGTRIHFMTMNNDKQ